jgi:lipoprotein-releasing system ATP-binding protein
MAPLHDVKKPVTDTATLIATGISKTYPDLRRKGGELVILRDASLTLDAAQSAAIMGPSGSGKSTFLNIIGTLEPPDTGTVRIAGKNPFELDQRELARFRNRTVGFIFQEHHLLPQCTVLENVLLPTLANRQSQGRAKVLFARKHPIDNRQSPDTSRERKASGPGFDHYARAHKLLDRVGLSDRLDHRPAELSGGERQRVAIARAFINQPALLLADEPTGNLDRRTADAIAELLVEVFKQEQVALVVVTHSEQLAQRFDRTLELIDGAFQPT